ncbi:MAG TPA: biotin/lipoate A/B protein ligase family protein [Isosphaeraceae bacterium]
MRNMEACRVLPHESGDGAENMALDEALLDSVAADPSAAVVRTYSWPAPTLSLGYFQPIALAESDPRWRGVPIVRRPTGGGALWHDREVTYAVIIPAGHPLARRSADLYRAVHGALAGLLTEAGVEARRRGAAGAAPDAKPFLCFADRDAEDVVAGPAKLVGSAQRRRAGAVLQHGSILLAGSSRTPELPGLAEVANVAIEPAAWARRIAESIPPTLGLASFRGEISSEERATASRLAAEVYRNPAWTRKR